MIGEGTHITNQRRHTYVRDNVEVGFFTDPTVCIGCKACEVACKEWNQVPDDGFVWSGNSYDNTGHLGASTWRHVMFVEQDRQKGGQIVGSHSLGNTNEEDPFRWIFLSDVCKHCEEAGCLEACPTGAIVRTEVGSVLVQNDVCNGCGYCVVSCPFGVIDRRPQPLPDAGGAFKCTFCYDRQKSGLTPACATRLRRRATLRSHRNVRARHSRVFPDSRRARSVRPSAKASDSDNSSEGRVDGCVCHCHRCNRRHSLCICIFMSRPPGSYA